MRPAILLVFTAALVAALPARAAHRHGRPAAATAVHGRHMARLRGEIDLPPPSHAGRHETARERRAHGVREREAAAQARAEARASTIAAERRAAAAAARRLLGPPAPTRAVVAHEIVLEDGETLAAAAARIGVSAAAFAKLNGLEASDEPATGQRLKLPPPGGGSPTTRLAADTPPRFGPASDAGPVLPQDLLNPAPVATASAGPRPYRTLGPDSAARPLVPTGPAPVQTSRRGRTEADAMAAYAVASTRAPSLAGRSDAVHTRFVWPVRGEVLSPFGSSGLGRRNDGLDLAARPGDPVRAAAAGEVVYAGKEIAGSGSLVLLKHADGWVTAYAKLGRVTVAMRQTVDQGQEIGEAGASATFEAPRLHFEVRAPSPTGARPVDPAGVLPPA